MARTERPLGGKPAVPDRAALIDVRLERRGWEGVAVAVSGEEFLRALAAEIVEQGDVEQWWSRFSSAYQALAVVEAIDEVTARQIGEEIRAGLRARTGVEVPGFHLGSRHRGGGALRRHRPAGGELNLADFGVRSAWARLPASMASGGIDFVSWADQGVWLVCSGAGPAPWPQPEPFRPSGGTGGFVALGSGADRPLSPEQAMFSQVVDDRGRPYRLQMSSSGASNAGSKRERWDLRLHLAPIPDPATRWLRFDTPHGPATAPLEPPTPTAAVTSAREEVMDAAEFYLHRQLHNHAWLYLLDPERPLARLGVVADALVAVGALSSDHRLVTAAKAVDDTIAGQQPTGLPAVLATALKPGARSPAWIGCAAIAIAVSHPEGGELGLEALVGHPDRLALHFVQPRWHDQAANARNLVVSATDDQGRGHVSGTEPLSNPGEGAFHLRPPLAANAKHLTVRLEGPSTVTDISIDLTGSHTGNRTGGDPSP